MIRFDVLTDFDTSSELVEYVKDVIKRARLESRLISVSINDKDISGYVKRRCGLRGQYAEKKD